MRRSQAGFGAAGLLLIIFIVGISAFVYYRVKQADDQIAQSKITSFDECVAAGNPVMESYPEQCAADGQTFVRDIQKQDDANVETIPEEQNVLSMLDGYLTLNLTDKWQIDSQSTKSFTTSDDSGDVKLNCVEQAVLEPSSNESLQNRLSIYMMICENKQNLNPTDFYKRYESIYPRWNTKVEEYNTFKIDNHDAQERYTERSTANDDEETLPGYSLDYTVTTGDYMMFIYTAGLQEEYINKVGALILSMNFQD